MAVGRIAAETAVPYPPGIPALAPGERIQAEVLKALQAEVATGTRIAYCGDPSLATVLVVGSKHPPAAGWKSATLALILVMMACLVPVLLVLPQTQGQNS